MDRAVSNWSSKGSTRTQLRTLNLKNSKFASSKNFVHFLKTNILHTVVHTTFVKCSSVLLFRHILQEEGAAGALSQPELLLGLHRAGQPARDQNPRGEEGEGRQDSVSDQYSFNPDPAKNLNSDPNLFRF